MYAGPSSSAATSLYTNDKSANVSVAQTSPYDKERLPERQPRHQPQYDNHGGTPFATASSKVADWTPVALLISYFVFSIAFYTLLNSYATKVFWFLYLSIGTCLAGVTCLEAYDGLSPLKEAGKTLVKHEKSGGKFATADQDLPLLELVFNADRESIEWIYRELENMPYPQEKVRITALSEWNSASALDTKGAVIAMFGGFQVPHPHAPRHAVERLLKDKKADIVQSRSVRTYASNASAVRRTFGSLACLAHDMLYSLLLPGRTVTWTLGISTGHGTYWRAQKLHAAMIAVTSSTSKGPRDGLDLGYAAFAQGAKAVYDLSVITYSPCPATFTGYMRTLSQPARKSAVTTVRHLKLVFTGIFRKRSKTSSTEKGDQSMASKRTFKQRLGLFYNLLLLPLGSHAILQYFSLALATIITNAPSSSADFATRIYFPYPISIWLIVGGLVCLMATVAFVYNARSEFAPSPWSFPLVLVLYPLALVFWACLDLYGQASALVKGSS